MTLLLLPAPPCDFAPTLSQSPFSPFSQLSYRGCTPPPAPTPVRSLLRQSSSRTMTLFSRALQPCSPSCCHGRDRPQSATTDPGLLALSRRLQLVQQVPSQDVPDRARAHEAHHPPSRRVSCGRGHLRPVRGHRAYHVLDSLLRRASEGECEGTQSMQHAEPGLASRSGRHHHGALGAPTASAVETTAEDQPAPIGASRAGRSRRGCQTSFALGGRSFRGSPHLRRSRSPHSRSLRLSQGHHKPGFLFALLGGEREDLSWAKELLPTSAQGAQAHSDLALQPTRFSPVRIRIVPSRACTTPLSPHQALWHMRGAHHGSAECPSTAACQQGLPSYAEFSRGRSVAHAHAALLATQEEWQAEAHQDGRTPALGMRKTARESAPGHPPLQGSSHASGAGEALCHWRGTIEPMVANGTLEHLVTSLDLVNMFGNVGWPCIRKALRPHFPEALPTELSGSISQTPSPLPTGASSPTGVRSRETCSAPPRARWVWDMRATPTWVSTSPTLSRPKVFVTSGSSTMGGSFFDLGPFDLWLQVWGHLGLCGTWQGQELCASSLPASAYSRIHGVGHAACARHRHRPHL